MLTDDSETLRLLLTRFAEGHDRDQIAFGDFWASRPATPESRDPGKQSLLSPDHHHIVKRHVFQAKQQRFEVIVVRKLQCDELWHQQLRKLPTLLRFPESCLNPWSFFRT